MEGLERKLAEEIECRNRAEKRLEHALKKLESLKILDVPRSSASSSSSHYCFSGHQKLECWVPGSPTVDSGQCGSQEEAPSALGDEVSGSSLVDWPHDQEGSWSSAGTAPSLNKGESHWDESNGGGSPQVSIADAERYVNAQLALHRIVRQFLS